MESTSRSEMAQKAKVTHGPPQTPLLTKRQKLERWSRVLDKDPRLALNTFNPTEYLDAAIRDSMRCEGSALSVASSDPLLRDAGMHDDTYGTAKRFFELSDRELHYLVCYCHHGQQVEAGVFANIVRAFASKNTGPSLISRVWQLFGLRQRAA